MKSMNLAARAAILIFLPTAAFLKAADVSTVTVKGYVLDSACAFTKSLNFMGIPKSTSPTNSEYFAQPVLPVN